MKGWLWIFPALAVSFMAGRLLREEGEKSKEGLSDRVVGEGRERSLGSWLSAPESRERDLYLRVKIAGMESGELEKLWRECVERFELGDEGYEGDDEAVELMQAVLERMGEVDPELGVALAGEVRIARYQFYPAVAAGWARTDLEGALAWVRGSDDARLRRGAFPEIIEEVGRTDRRAALEIYLRGVKERTMPAMGWNMREMFEDWAEEDGEAAVRMAMEVRGWDKRVDSWEAMEGAISSWASRDPQAVANWVGREMKGDDRKRSYLMLLDGWSEMDPEAAGEFLKGKKDEAFYDRGVASVMRAWVKRDFDETVAWVENLGDAGLREDLVMLAKYVNQEKGMEYALQHFDDAGVRYAVREQLWNFAGKDAKKAFEWIEEKVGEGQEKGKFEREVLGRWLVQNPAEAIEVLGEYLPEGNEKREGMFRWAAHEWGKQDPKEATKWVGKYPEGELREEMKQGMLEGWIREDFNGAREWFAELPAEQVNDGLREVHALETSYQNRYEQAFEDARSIEDPFVRDRVWESVLSSWYGDKIKAEVAKEFIDATPEISETARWRIFNRARSR